MTSNIHFQTILYDLDGTLIDHFATIYRSFAHAITRLGLEPPSFERVKATVGGSAPVTMGKLIGTDRADEAMVHFDEYFAANIFDGLEALPGATWLLESLHRRGYRQAVFTNKSGPAAREVCTHLGFDRWIEAAIGAGDTPYRKPQPEFSQHILSRLGTAPGTTLMVGDSPFDLEAGAAVGMRCAAVCTGSHTRAQLDDCGFSAIGIYDDLYELGHQLFGLPLPEQYHSMPTARP